MTEDVKKPLTKEEVNKIAASVASEGEILFLEDIKLQIDPVEHKRITEIKKEAKAFSSMISDAKGVPIVAVKGKDTAR